MNIETEIREILESSKANANLRAIFLERGWIILRQLKDGKDIKQPLYVPTVYLDFTGIKFMQAVGKFSPDSEGIETDYLHVYFYFSPDEKHPEPELFLGNLKDFKKNGYLYILMHFDWSCNVLYGCKLLQWCGGQEDSRSGLVKDLMPKY